jgi:hypothetical protein
MVARIENLSVGLAEHVHAATVPTQRELNEWLHSINRAAPVYWALESAYAQGQVEYWHRKDKNWTANDAGCTGARQGRVR